MNPQEPAKRPRGRPRMHPPAPAPARRLDPRRFAAAYAAHLMRHGGAGPATAANAAALVFAPGFGLYETDLVMKLKPHQVTPNRYNATASFPGSFDEVDRSDDALPWPIARLRSEGRMIRRTLARLQSNPADADWLSQSVMLIAIMGSGRADETTRRVVAGMIDHLGWSNVLPKLAKAILTPQKHTKSIT